MHFPEIGCKSSVECPHQKACINSLCVDPCAYHQCAQGQNCHVDNHQPICVHTGKFFFPKNDKIEDIATERIYQNSSTHILGREPYDCSHCSGGVCDQLTGACVKGNFDCSLQYVDVLRISMEFTFDKFYKSGIFHLI